MFDNPRDPDDDVFLATAVDGNATMLVSGDKMHLLPLGKFRGIPIVSAADAVLRLGLR